MAKQARQARCWCRATGLHLTDAEVSTLRQLLQEERAAGDLLTEHLMTPPSIDAPVSTWDAYSEKSHRLETAQLGCHARLSHALALALRTGRGTR
jgi:hypothetical protein